MVRYIDGFVLPVPKRNVDATRAMKDPRLADMDPKKMPFDLNRMLYGGFKVLVAA